MLFERFDSAPPPSRERDSITTTKKKQDIGGLNTECLKVDCEAERELSSKYEITKYPTIKYVQVSKFRFFIFLNNKEKLKIYGFTLQKKT